MHVSQAKEITVLIWAEHPALKDAYLGMQAYFDEEALNEPLKINVKNAYENVGNAMLIADQAAQQKVDAIYAIATPAAQAAVSRTSRIPVVFAAVSDPVAAGLMENIEKPEGYVTGVSDYPPLEKQVDLMQTLLPDLKRVAVLYHLAESNSLKQVSDLQKILEDRNLILDAQGLSAAEEIAIASQKAAKKSDTTLIVNDNMIASATGLVCHHFALEKKPCFMSEAGQFDQGVFASESISYFDLGYEAGRILKAIVFEEEAVASFPVYYAEETSLHLNQDLAQQWQMDVPQSLLERLR